MSVTESLKRFEQLVRIREAEEGIRREYDRDEMKTPVHLGIGGEGITVGVAAAVPPGTPMFGSYRNHALFLTLTNDLESFFGEMYGRATGVARGKAGSMHLMSPANGLVVTSAVVGTTLPIAAGAALAHQYRGSDAPVVSFFGDGATEEGVFWETINFAVLKRLPLLFVCEDNELAIHTPRRDRQGFASLTRVVAEMGCAVAEVDGADVDAVATAAQALLAQMEAERRPALLRCTYLRRLEHVGPREDFDAGYRAAPTDDEWRERDPVARCEAQLLGAGVAPTTIDTIRATERRRVEAAIAHARAAAFASPSELWTDVTA